MLPFWSSHFGLGHRGWPSLIERLLQSQRKDRNRLSFSLLSPRKNSKEGTDAVSLFEKKIVDIKTCPVECLRVYLIHTFDNCSTIHERLLLSFVAPNNPVSGNTICRWIKSCLNLADIDTKTFSEHSTRSAATPYAARQEMSIDAILKAGDWKHESTSERFYNRPL